MCDVVPSKSFAKKKWTQVTSTPRRATKNRLTEWPCCPITIDHILLVPRYHESPDYVGEQLFKQLAPVAGPVADAEFRQTLNTANTWIGPSTMIIVQEGCLSPIDQSSRYVPVRISQSSQ